MAKQKIIFTNTGTTTFKTTISTYLEIRDLHEKVSMFCL